MDEVVSVKFLILDKLTRARRWGGKHWPLDFIYKGLPTQFRMTHSGQKVIEKALKELQNDEWIVLGQKKTGKNDDDHISLNPRKVADIQTFLSNRSR